MKWIDSRRPETRARFASSREVRAKPNAIRLALSRLDELWCKDDTEEKWIVSLANLMDQLAERLQDPTIIGYGRVGSRP